MSEIINESFKTVFTEEEFTESNRTLHCQGLQEIMVHKQFGRLLENLDVRKVMGQDGVSVWALQEFYVKINC
ncbi:hypothetical protein E2C01_045103 [Portunus trituberculatus]|uniref:Uncharacterized protein n=1 Tax=Portunus trituberculatus TaxID=210409 RepID=A0A5B7G289_PORTR|nr:hypothetical protein [Portunus trituberculatus]